MARPLQFATLMHEKRPCPRCGREIDAVAKICPYCNADPLNTSQVSLAAEPAPRRKVPAPVQKKPMRSVLFVAIGAVILTVLAIIFTTGRDDAEANRVVTETSTTTVATTSSPATTSSEFPELTLGSSDPTAGVARSITTTPAVQPNIDIPAELQREDATALPSTEYAAILARSREQERTQKPVPAGGAVDPRTIVAPSPIPTVARTTPRPQPKPTETPRDTGSRDEEAEPPTRTSDDGDFRPPVPTAQPLPRFRSSELRESGTVRMRLTVGADGRVKEVEMLQTLPGITPKIVQAVQQWRFKPAERNGNPVEGTFTTDIFFKADE